MTITMTIGYEYTPITMPRQPLFIPNKKPPPCPPKLLGSLGGLGDLSESCNSKPTALKPTDSPNYFSVFGGMSPAFTMHAPFWQPFGQSYSSNDALW